MILDLGILDLESLSNLQSKICNLKFEFFASAKKFFFLPLLVAASRCRFWLPLLVAVWQRPNRLCYNISRLNGGLGFSIRDPQLAACTAFLLNLDCIFNETGARAPDFRLFQLSPQHSVLSFTVPLL
jgi:hypothetical protein